MMEVVPDKTNVHGGRVTQVNELVEGFPLDGATQLLAEVCSEVLLRKLQHQLEVPVLLPHRPHLGDLVVVQLVHVVVNLTGTQCHRQPRVYYSSV